MHMVVQGAEGKPVSTVHLCAAVQICTVAMILHSTHVSEYHMYTVLKLHSTCAAGPGCVHRISVQKVGSEYVVLQSKGQLMPMKGYKGQLMPTQDPWQQHMMHHRCIILSGAGRLLPPERRCPAPTLTYFVIDLPCMLTLTYLHREGVDTRVFGLAVIFVLAFGEGAPAPIVMITIAT